MTCEMLLKDSAVAIFEGKRFYDAVKSSVGYDIMPIKVARCYYRDGVSALGSRLFKRAPTEGELEQMMYYALLLSEYFRTDG